MFELRLIYIILKPTFLGFSTAILASAAIIGIANWSYLASTPWLYDFFYGDYGIVTTAEMSPQAIDTIGATVSASLSGENEYRIAVILVAILAGVAAIVAVRNLRRAIKGAYALTSDDADEREEQLQRVIVRIVTVGLWVMYAYFYFNFAQPMCFLLARLATDSLNPLVGGAIWLGSILILSTALHIHVIFARIALLKPRIFGGQFEIEETLLGR